MKLIVGLGNYGDKYNWTRHNIGFEIIDQYSKKYNIDLNENKFNGIYKKTKILNEDVILAKPHTFMNLSGEFIYKIINYYKIQVKDLLVIYDDISLNIGDIKIKQKGSSGGHNGIKNIINMLQTDEFSRIKIGIGKPNINLADYVLSKFNNEEKQKIISKFDDLNKIINMFIENKICR